MKNIQGPIFIDKGTCPKCHRVFSQYPLGKCKHEICPFPGAYDPDFRWGDEEDEKKIEKAFYNDKNFYLFSGYDDKCEMCTKTAGQIQQSGCDEPSCPRRMKENKSTSDGSTASYYELPPNATELQHLISYKNMNAQIGEIFRACYRYGEASHSAQLRDAKKIRFYADAEIERLEKYETSN